MSEVGGGREKEDKLESIMEFSRIKFMIDAIYYMLPSPQKLNQWLGEDVACLLCSICSLRYIQSGCKVSL